MLIWVYAFSCIWVNLGGVLRQRRSIAGRTTQIKDTTVTDSPGCGLLVSGRKSTPMVEKCTFRNCRLAGISVQQEGQPTIAACKILDNFGFGCKWWRLAAGHLVKCVVSGNESAGLFVVGKGTNPGTPCSLQIILKFLIHI